MGQTYPLPITPAMLAVANANADKPRPWSPGDWAGGAIGDERQATATVALANSHSANVEANYSPRTHADKAAVMGTGVVEDIARPRGWVAPNQVLGPKPAAPVVTAISPTTAPAAQLPLVVTITGTGFSVWSTVHVGGQNTADVSGKFINATTMQVALFKASPGQVSVAVKDHDVLSNVDKLFTVT